MDEVEQTAIDRLKQIFSCEYANVQPHSGAQANMAVYFSAIQPGDKILAMNLAHGGHLTHGHPANFSGKFYTVAQYGVSEKTEQIDYDALQKQAEEVRPLMITAGASAYPRIIDFPRLRQIADSVGALLFIDMAHIAGLVAGGQHPSPIPHAHFVTTTTHKSLRGPRGGIVMCDEKFAKQILLTLRKRARLVPWDYFHGAMVIGLVVSAVVIFPYQSGFLSNSPYTLANQAIGHYVASITLEGNAIWTSEGSIAFFASRLIQPPNSTQWPFQAAYNDIFNTTYVDADGVTHEGLGAVSPSEFVEAWQSHNTTVLVFILGTGPVPYPDDFLWYGFPGTEGVSRWVNSNYQLVSAPTFPNVGYQYFIWLRK